MSLVLILFAEILSDVTSLLCVFLYKPLNSRYRVSYMSAHILLNLLI